MVGRGASVEQLEQLVRDGHWLAPGLVARVLGVGRTTFHDWLTAGKDPEYDIPIRYRKVGAQRRVDPESVLAILARHREVHGGS